MHFGDFPLGGSTKDYYRVELACLGILGNSSTEGSNLQDVSPTFRDFGPNLPQHCKFHGEKHMEKHAAQSFGTFGNHRGSAQTH